LVPSGDLTASMVPFRAHATIASAFEAVAQGSPPKGRALNVAIAVSFMPSRGTQWSVVPLLGAQRQGVQHVGRGPLSALVVLLRRRDRERLRLLHRDVR